MEDIKNNCKHEWMPSQWFSKRFSTSDGTPMIIEDKRLEAVICKHCLEQKTL